MGCGRVTCKHPTAERSSSGILICPRIALRLCTKVSALFRYFNFAGSGRSSVMASIILRIIPSNEIILQLLLRELNNQACELAQSGKASRCSTLLGILGWLIMDWPAWISGVFVQRFICVHLTWPDWTLSSGALLLKTEAADLIPYPVSSGIDGLKISQSVSSGYCRPLDLAFCLLNASW